jgi:hypothetical protein
MRDFGNYYRDKLEMLKLNDIWRMGGVYKRSDGQVID